MTVNGHSPPASTPSATPPHVADASPAAWRATLRARRTVSSDGTGLAYEVLGQGTRTVVLANGLGGRLYTWEPLIDAIWRDHHFPNFLRLFQELDAHSVYHLLPEHEAPALVIGGQLDTLTPAFQSREMARRLPHAQLIALWRSSHFSLVERPEVVVPAIRRFLDDRARY